MFILGVLFKTCFILFLTIGHMMPVINESHGQTKVEGVDELNIIANKNGFLWMTGNRYLVLTTVPQ